jgi:hypothetical protein
MTADRAADHVWKLINKIAFCMLSTHDGEDIRAHPAVGGSVKVKR